MTIRPLSIRLFGRSRCTCAGAEIPFPARPATRSLFAALAFAETALERDWLASALWPDVTDTAAGANLRRHLSYTSKWLRDVTACEEPIVRSGDFVALDRAIVGSVDVRAFGDAVGRGDLESAARAYGGDLLEDLDDAWIEPARQRLRAEYVDVLSHLVEGARASGDYETALRYAHTARAADPYAEDWLRTAMRVRYAAGDRAGALAEYEKHRQLVARDLNLEPMPETIMLADSMRRIEESVDARERAVPKPFESTAFVGRTRERAAIGEALERGHTITISGEPGAGKSRLGLRVARDVADARDVPLVVIDAGSAGDAEHLERSTERALRDRAGAVIHGTLDEAAAGSRAVVVFDGCERVRDACAELVRRLRGASADIAIVATSRIPLGVDNETVLRLGPLETSDAAALFRARVRATRAEARDGDLGGDTVERICNGLGGLPLAIELAAARASVSTLAQVEREVLRYGELPGRDVLHATYESSYALLNETERAVWRQLAAFANGWNESVALAACAGFASELAFREAASTLVRHSLVIPPGFYDAAERYAMLDATRDFAQHRARQLGESDRAKYDHALAVARHYVAIGSRLRAERAHDYYPEVERDLANIDLALDTLAGGAVADRALATDLCLAVSRFWADQGHARTGERRLRAALEDATLGDAGKRLELLRVAGTLARDLGDYAGSYRDFSALVGLHDRVGSAAVERAKAQTMAANAARMLGNFDDALDRTRDAYEAFVANGEPYFAAWAVYALGTTLLSAGRSGEAATELERATHLFNDAGATADSSSSIANLALCAFYEGRYETAAELTRESVRRAADAGHKYYYAHAILNEASISYALGDAARAWERVVEAVRIGATLDALDLSISCAETAATQLAAHAPGDAAALLASADRARVAAHAPRFPIDRPLDERLRETLVAALGEARYEACVARGRVTGLREALGRLT